MPTKTTVINLQQFANIPSTQANSASSSQQDGKGVAYWNASNQAKAWCGWLGQWYFC